MGRTSIILKSLLVILFSAVISFPVLLTTLSFLRKSCGYWERDCRGVPILPSIADVLLSPASADADPGMDICHSDEWYYSVSHNCPILYWQAFSLPAPLWVAVGTTLVLIWVVWRYREALITPPCQCVAAWFVISSIAWLSLSFLLFALPILWSPIHRGG